MNRIPEMERDFDRAVVMDACGLSGLAMCELAETVCGPGRSIHVTGVAGLEVCLERLQGLRVLIIARLHRSEAPLSRSLALLSRLRARRAGDGNRVLVCTDLTDPLLLRIIQSAGPSVMALRRESIPVLRQAILMARGAWPDTVLSPAVTQGMERARDIRFRPRELTWLVTQADGLGLQASALAMGVSYKTVATYRRNVARQLSQAGGGAFMLWLARMRASAGSACGALVAKHETVPRPDGRGDTESNINT